MSRHLCPSCGTITTPPVPTFDLDRARVDGFGSMHFGGVTVHDWGSDPQLEWPADRPGWRFLGLYDWSDESYPTAEAAARAAWFDALDPMP